MEKWLISKEFEFDFGHRVWTQALDPNYALSTQCVCKRLHGHRGKVIVELTTDAKYVHETGLVTDFKHLAFFKRFIDDFIDHRFLIDIHDPFIDQLNLINLFETAPVHSIYANGRLVQNPTGKNAPLTVTDLKVLLKSIDAPLMIVPVVQNADNIEESNWNESFVFCNFVPTAENIAKYFYVYLTDAFLETPINVNKITFYETPKSQAVYYKG